MHPQQPNFKLRFLLVLCTLLIAFLSPAQDLDPRAYLRVPIKTTNFISGFAYSYGDIVSDPSLAIKNIKADAQTLSLGVARSFNLAGKTAQALVMLPYTWADASGEVNEQNRSISRSGFSDMRLRLSVLLAGAPAQSLADFVKHPSNKTIVGVSLNVVAPTGQFFPDKLINLGTNRWAFRPELALSQPIGKGWLLDVYAGCWLFTNNNSFYPGNAVRTQDPMGAFQGHISYNFKPNLWIALTTTYYAGGESAVNETANDDRQSNMRVGLTAVVPTGKMSSLKLAASTGAIVRIGQDFTTLSIGWQRAWISMKKQPGHK